MNVKNQFKVRWEQADKSTFLYGSKINFKQLETVFENSLMPSGIVIQEWKMLSNYAEDRLTPVLPILKKGYKYRFYFDYDVIPVHSVYFKIIFYHKNRTMITSEIVKRQQVIIEYPENAYAYKIQMINAASSKLTFKQIVIEEQGYRDEENDMKISEVVNLIPSLDFINVVIAEPSQIGYSKLSKYAIQHINNAVVVKHWSDKDMEHNLQAILAFLKQKTLRNKINIIGHGSKSNEVVKIMNRIVECNAYITAHSDFEYEKELSALFSKETTLAKSMPYIYFDEQTSDDQLIIFQNVLNNVRYLKYLDSSLINGEVFNETEN